MIQNQFITPEELSSLHLQTLLAKHSPQQPPAKHASDSTIARILAQLTEGNTQISKTVEDAANLLDPQAIDESQVRLEANRKKYEEREEINQLLYNQNKNNQSVKHLTANKRLLSAEEHHQFVKNMKKQHQKRKQFKEKRSRSEQQRIAAKEEAQKKQSQEKRMSEIEKKKESIKESLRKMRQNHEKMLASEKQSQSIFNKIRKKKRIYQQMQQSHDQKAAQIARQTEQRLIEQRQENKMDFTALKNHEKQYFQMKKEKKLEKSRTKTSNHAYIPPPHSKKLTSILEEESKKWNRYGEKKKRMEEKLQKMAQYSSLLKERNKGRSPPRSKTIATDRQNSTTSDHHTLKQHVDRTQLGNEYLKQIKQITKKRTKTEERYYNPQHSVVTVSPSNLKKRITTLSYIPEEKRSTHIERMKKSEIEKMLTLDHSMSQADRLKRVKMADQRLKKELRKMQGKHESRQNALSLLLGTIRAKINLIDGCN